MLTNTKKFVDYCCKAHCQTCRKAVTGLKFRLDISNSFLLPENNVNFTCPHGLEWMEQADPLYWPVDKIVVEKLEESKIPSLEDLENTINSLGNPEYLKMKLNETKQIIDNANCTNCVSVARRKDLNQKIYDWKRLNNL